MTFFRSVIFAGVLASIVSIYTVSRLESRSAETKMSQVSGLLESGQGVAQLANEMDKFREASAELKSMSVADGKIAIERIQGKFEKTLAQINRAPLEERERKALDGIQAKI